MSRWPMVRLSEVLQLQRRWIKLHPTEVYREIGIRSFGHGVFHKSPVLGSTLGNKRVLRIEPGDLVFNNVFAWEGAVAVAGPEEAGMIGSHRFITYTVNRAKAIAKFLQLFFKTERGREILLKASPGSAGRNRTLGLDRFITESIYLPPLAEQRRLVEHIDMLACWIEEGKRLRHSAQAGSIALIKAAQRQLVGEAPQADWVPLSSILEHIANGWSPACESRQVTSGEWGVLKVGAVSFGTYNPKENKALPMSLSPRPEYEVRPGDFIMSRANTFELVGACAPVFQTPPRLMLSDKLFRFIFRKNAEVDMAYLDHVLKSPALRDQIVRGASGTSPTMKNISKEKVLALLIPGHSLATQKEIAVRLNRLREHVEAANTIQEATSKELDAMLPAILDRAFLGGALNEH